MWKGGKLELDLRPAIPAYLIDDSLTLETAMAGAGRLRCHFSEVRNYSPGTYAIKKLKSTHTAAEIRLGAAAEVDVWLE